MAKKIIVISMRAGLGHIKAGQALEEYARMHRSDLKVSHVDLCEIEPRLGKFFEVFYDIANERLPMVWGAVYDAFNKEPVSAAFRKMNGFEKLFNNQISRYLKKQNVDGIIFTNVIPAPMIAPPCRKIFPNAPLAVVVTDYHGHSYYNVPLVDRFFVAIPEVASDLVRVGVDSAKIKVTGIPVSQKFYENYDQKRLKNKMGFASDSKTILFVSRLTKDFVVPAAKGILAAGDKVNLIMVCGGNNELFKKISEIIPPQKNFKLVNWTNRLDEYLKIADAVVSKPGGLMISECLALGKKIIMTEPIPGQEEYNAEFIAKYDYGIFASTSEDIISAAQKVISQNTVRPAAKPPANPCAAILDYFK